MKSRKAVTYVEILISVLALAAISLGLASFSSQYFHAVFVHSQQLDKINFARFSAEHIIDEVKKAEYIYPAGIELSLSGQTAANINTSKAIALLIPVDKDNLMYRFTAFYLSSDGNNLIEFHSDDDYFWDKNTIPAESIVSISGSSQIIASDMKSDNQVLNYVLNYNNGRSDSVLKGEIANVSTNTLNALIKGIKWDITINKGKKEVIRIDGISNNVPRYISE